MTSTFWKTGTALATAATLAACSGTAQIPDLPIGGHRWHRPRPRPMAPP